MIPKRLKSWHPHLALVVVGVGVTAVLTGCESLRTTELSVEPGVEPGVVETSAHNVSKPLDSGVNQAALGGVRVSVPTFDR